MWKGQANSMPYKFVLQDQNAQLSYHLVDPDRAFSIDTMRGIVSVANSSHLDREANEILSFQVMLIFSK